MATHGEPQRDHQPPPPPPPPPPPARPLMVSALSYLAEPLRYTTTALLRRLAEDGAPTPLAKALSANYNGSMADATTGVYRAPRPPTRKRSPFQPPPLTPLTLSGYAAETTGDGRLLHKAVAEEIRLLLPPRLQVVAHWTLAYSLEQNGSALSTLYSLCDAFRGQRGGFVVVVRDAQGGVFGAYLSDAPRPHPHYFGTGECFLWRAVVLPALPDLLLDLPPPPSADTTRAQRMTTIGIAPPPRSPSSGSLHVPGAGPAHGNGTVTPQRIRFKAFPYTGENDFTIYCAQDYLSVGGGDGHYGLWLGQGLGHGVSDACPTFGNEALSEEGSKFDVMGVEVWYVGS